MKKHIPVPRPPTLLTDPLTVGGKIPAITLPGGQTISGRRAYTPMEPTFETLTGQNHAEWLHQFSQLLSLDTGVEMTPFRQGQITRLLWAARWVEYLEKQNDRLQRKIAKLERSGANEA